MTFFRLGLLVAATILSSCSIVTTAPEPADFKLSAEALSHKFHATRKTGAVRLYAQKIETTRDQWGRETHLASGGALLVKETNPPIMAQALSISITPEYSEARGKATVKKNDRLYIGQDDATAIRIDGTEIILDGPIIIREVAAEEDPAKTSETEKTEKPKAAVPAPKKEAPQVAPSPIQPESAKEKQKMVGKPKAEINAPAKTTPPPTAKPSSSHPTAKPNSPPQAAKPKQVPPVDRKRLLNLMREPTDR